MEHSKGWIAGIVLAVALALAAGGCAPAAPKGPTPQEIAQREAAERELAEKVRQEAEARRLEEERRQQQALMDAFGPVGEPPPSVLAPKPAAAPAAPEQPAATGTPAAVAGAATGGTVLVEVAPPAGEGGTPYIPQGTTTGTVRIDLSRTGPAMAGSIPFDEAVPALPADPVVRVAILSARGQWHKAREVALSLSAYEREPLEERIGRALHVAYVAESTRVPRYPSEVHYRDPQFLHAAQAVATALAARQWVAPMTAEEIAQQSVDLVVYLGPDYR